jgi:hypothetical protein
MALLTPTSMRKLSESFGVFAVSFRPQLRVSIQVWVVLPGLRISFVPLFCARS